MILPWGVIEWGLRLAVLLIEGQPPELRRASALLWFWRTWPLLKLGLHDNVARQIEAMMEPEKP